MRVHHIGYLVKDINKAAKSHELLGYKGRGDVSYDEARDADMLFLENGDYLIELVAPRGETSVAWNLLKKHGNIPYHICYETNDINATMEELIKSGFVPLGTVAEAPAIGTNADVAFLISRDIGLIELVVETPSEKK